MKNGAANPADSILSLLQTVIFITLVTTAPTAWGPLLPLFARVGSLLRVSAQGLLPGMLEGGREGGGGNPPHCPVTVTG